jgi:hypothetical protein
MRLPRRFLCDFWSAAFSFPKAFRNFFIRRILRPTLRQNWYSQSGKLGTVCWRMRSRLRRATRNWAANPARSHCAAGRHQRRNSFDKNSAPSRSRFLGFLASEARPLWFLEHDARGAHRFFHVARPTFSAHRRCGKKMVAGCSDCVGKQHLITASTAASGMLSIYSQALRDVNRDQKAV